MIIDKGIFVNFAKDVSPSDMISNLRMGHGYLIFWRLDVMLDFTLKFKGSKSHLRERSRASVLIPLGIYIDLESSWIDWCQVSSERLETIKMIFVLEVVFGCHRRCYSSSLRYSKHIVRKNIPMGLTRA